jgi:hypothetical protein
MQLRLRPCNADVLKHIHTVRARCMYVTLSTCGGTMDHKRIHVHYSSGCTNLEWRLYHTLSHCVEGGRPTFFTRIFPSHAKQTWALTSYIRGHKLWMLLLHFDSNWMKELTSTWRWWTLVYFNLINEVKEDGQTVVGFLGLLVGDRLTAHTWWSSINVLQGRVRLTNSALEYPPNFHTFPSLLLRP